MMSKPMTLSQAAIAHGGTLMYPDCQFSSVSIDSRNLRQGELFVALEGERFDAHQFLPQVSEKAAGLVVRQAVQHLHVPQWVVADTTLALGQLARMYRDRFEGKLIAITGSGGKTTVKEMLASILRECGKVTATKGNLNNHIGVPLTLFSLRSSDDFAVVEMGASGPGEISYLCSLAWPDVVLVNNVMPAHVEGFGGVDAIARAKGEIYSGVNPAGTAVINLDEPYADEWCNRSVAIRTLRFSTSREDADFRAVDIEQDEKGRCAFVLLAPKGRIAVRLALSGKHNVANALAAAACACAVGAPLQAVARGLAGMSSVDGRLSLHEGINESLVIDDSYNANPGSVKAAIDTLMSFSGERLLVLGDMAELGEQEVIFHEEVGRYAAEKGVSRLLATGELSINSVRECVIQGGDASHFDSKSELVEALLGALGPDTVVLVKGSRSAAMDEVVAMLTEPSNKTGEH
ncbi:MAG: UDP-N-acetylmuramoyl-tripeptide--D-alanyl-D-alanine ligase [Pseudomonadales bacterium]|nr:UDP-N-acetylmuramoyl-tripeptide--D-alanyl-D-alanine ligase [Pseudomonadales bacterium]